MDLQKKQNKCNSFITKLFPYILRLPWDFQHMKSGCLRKCNQLNNIKEVYLVPCVFPEMLGQNGAKCSAY